MAIEIRHLRQFLAVSEELHFTRAAERLHLAQPALSAQIKKLEEELELQLLVRSTRAVMLTPSGEEFAAKARIAVAAYDDALVTAAELRGGGTGHVSVGINPRIQSRVRMGILRRLGELAPQLSLDFVSESSVRLVTAVIEGRLDAAVVIAPTHTATLRSVLVRNTPLVVALPSTHPLAESRTLTLWDLRDEEWILPSANVFASNPMMQKLCLEAGFRMKVSTTATSNYDEDFVAVREGNGIEVVPEDFAPARSDAALVFIPLEGPTLPIYMIAQSDGQSRALGVVFRAVVDSTSREPASDALTGAKLTGAKTG
ncbi:LysR substrate-binding domain-containing protein [Leifsonia kafniensis]|uniref:LysR substrate-binding domain-containing protein n=1 Tax=Leifsonia kafniensis TaxID=475957 RepID=A0ABP7KRW2_9MICO